MKRAVILDIDDTLYNSSRLSKLARQNAVTAMIDAGLGLDWDTALSRLQDVIARQGSNYGSHFDDLIRDCGLEPNARIVAAGIVAYHNTKTCYLVPFEETVPTLLELRDRGWQLGIITNGKSVKQWEKLIRLGLQHFFHPVIISEEVGAEKPSPEIFQKACDQLDIPASDCVYVGNDPAKDIAGANAFGMVSVRIRRGKYRESLPDGDLEVARHDIDSLAELLELI